MYPFLKKAHIPHSNTLSFYSNLIGHCLSSKSLTFAKITHAQLVKVGFNRHTFLGNRFLDLYSRFGTADDALKVFDEITSKNCISWNIFLKGLLGFGRLESARNLFDEMPERDVVSWNSMISGCSSFGLVDYSLRIFVEMQNAGVRPSGFTFSILLSLVSCVWHGKEIHGSMIRGGIYLSNLVLGNSLINMYGKLGLVDYAFGVFLTMKELDIISWNSLIWACYESEYCELALTQFCLMRSLGNSTDHFTISTVLTVCSNLRNLEKGKQVLALSVKLGLISNTIVSSAAIDLFSKCNRLNDSVRLFREIDRWDSAICNAMISSYARHGSWEDALQLFILTLRESLRPTEFTLSSILSSVSMFLPMEQGSQIHCLVIKSGFESDAIVASSLVEMYAKFGAIDSAMEIFAKMGLRDLISWNTMILGLTRNGRVVGTLNIFKELLAVGPQPDRITITGVLLACNYGGLIDEGMGIFLSMEKEYGVIPKNEHYACIVDLLSRAGKVEEAMDVIKMMPHEADAIIWGSILCACYVHGDLKLTEMVAERMIELEPQSSLPYLVLAQTYQMRGRWESIVRVRKAMTDRGIDKVIGCSWIGIRSQIFVFEGNQLQHHGGKEMHLILRLIMLEMEDQGSVYQEYGKVYGE